MSELIEEAFTSAGGPGTEDQHQDEKTVLMKMMLRMVMAMRMILMKTLSELIEEAFTSAGSRATEWGSVTRDCARWTQGSGMGANFYDAASISNPQYFQPTITQNRVNRLVETVSDMQLSGGKIYVSIGDDSCK